MTAWRCQWCGGTERHDRRKCCMTTLNADPEFAAARRRGVDARYARPGVIAAYRARMQGLNADPEFAAARTRGTRARHDDPVFDAAHRERMRTLNADPMINPLVLLSEAERADYDILRGYRYRRREALAAIGRTDLIDGAAT